MPRWKRARGEQGLASPWGDRIASWPAAPLRPRRRSRALIPGTRAQSPGGSTLRDLSRGQTLEQIVSSVKKLSDTCESPPPRASSPAPPPSRHRQVNRAIMAEDELTQKNAAHGGGSNRRLAGHGGQARELNDMMGRYAWPSGHRVQGPSPLRAGDPRFELLADALDSRYPYHSSRRRKSVPPGLLPHAMPSNPRWRWVGGAAAPRKLAGAARGETIRTGRNLRFGA